MNEVFDSTVYLLRHNSTYYKFFIFIVGDPWNLIKIDPALLIHFVWEISKNINKSGMLRRLKSEE